MGKVFAQLMPLVLGVVVTYPAISYVNACLAQSTKDASQSSGVLAPSAFNLVGVLDLINRRNEFNGKLVVVEGYLVYGFERSAIYPTQEFADHSLDCSAIFLALPSTRGQDKTSANYVRPQSKYVRLKGLFVAHSGKSWAISGHFNQNRRLSPIATKIVTAY